MFYPTMCLPCLRLRTPRNLTKMDFNIPHATEMGASVECHVKSYDMPMSEKRTKMIQVLLTEKTTHKPPI